jgi:hypothetical protein
MDTNMADAVAAIAWVRLDRASVGGVPVRPAIPDQAVRILTTRRVRRDPCRLSRPARAVAQGVRAGTVTDVSMGEGYQPASFFSCFTLALTMSSWSSACFLQSF